tara:strand:- start:3912 stop:4493 length:582 start_codon:yes stop_codon:yes gene_type:complete
MKKIKAIGIDYSLNSPAICIATGDLSFENCKFYYVSSKKKYIGNFGKNIIGSEYKEWTDPIVRFNNLANWAIKSIRSYGDMNLFDGTQTVHIEGYSYGSKGQAIFQIAENCGILKHSLLAKKLKYETVVPSIVKKFATDKGNANKELMYEQFCKDTKTDLMKTFDMQTLSNPITDIVDAYYIARCGYESIKGK